MLAQKSSNARPKVSAVQVGTLERDSKPKLSRLSIKMDASIPDHPASKEFGEKFFPNLLFLLSEKIRRSSDPTLLHCSISMGHVCPYSKSAAQKPADESKKPLKPPKFPSYYEVLLPSSELALRFGAAVDLPVGTVVNFTLQAGSRVLRFNACWPHEQISQEILVKADFASIPNFSLQTIQTIMSMPAVIALATGSVSNLQATYITESGGASSSDGSKLQCLRSDVLTGTFTVPSAKDFITSYRNVPLEWTIIEGNKATKEVHTVNLRLEPAVIIKTFVWDPPATFIVTDLPPFPQLALPAPPSSSSPTVNDPALKGVDNTAGGKKKKRDRDTSAFPIPNPPGPTLASQEDADGFFKGEIPEELDGDDGMRT